MWISGNNPQKSEFAYFKFIWDKRISFEHSINKKTLRGNFRFSEGRCYLDLMTNFIILISQLLEIFIRSMVVTNIMSEVTMISAVTLGIRNMERSCSFYSHIPGFRLIFGGSSDDTFTSYQIGKHNSITFLNLELIKSYDDELQCENHRINFGRIIF